MPDELNELILFTNNHLEHIDELTRDFSGVSMSFFPGRPSHLPVEGASEFRFWQLVGFNHGLFFESGKILVQNLRRKKLLGVCTDRMTQFLETITSLRTFLFHNLSFKSERDFRIERACRDWYELACGDRRPSSDEHWLKCNIALQKSVNEHLSRIEAFIKERVEDENDYVLKNLFDKIEKNILPHQFDSFIERVANDLGRPGLDIVKFRNKNIGKWMDHIDSLSEEFDFDYEATRLVEYAVLNQTFRLLPITGSDVIEYFEIPPGNEVGRLLSLASEIYLIHPKLDKHTLLKKLSEQKSIC